MNVLRHLFKRLDQIEIEMDSSWSRDRSQVIADIRQKIVQYQIDPADLDVPTKRELARSRGRANEAAKVKTDTKAVKDDAQGNGDAKAAQQEPQHLADAPEKAS